MIASTSTYMWPENPGNLPPNSWKRSSFSGHIKSQSYKISFINYEWSAIWYATYRHYWKFLFAKNIKFEMRNCFSQHYSLVSIRTDTSLAWMAITGICSKKHILYTNFMVFSRWFQLHNFQNDPMADIKGQPVIGHLWPSPPACFGRREGFESSVVAAKLGGRSWTRMT